jgi:inosose dehydratase
VRIGCNTGTWEMFGPNWGGRLDDVLDAVASAGYEGIEIDATMLSEYARKPAALMRALTGRSLELAAYSIKLSISGGKGRTADPGSAIDTALRFVREFAGALLVLKFSCDELSGSAEAVAHMAELCNDVGRRGQSDGVDVAFGIRANGALVPVPDILPRALELMDPKLVTCAFDVVDIQGRMAAVDFIDRYKDRLAHVYLRDVDAAGAQRPLGQGNSDIAGIIGHLREIGYERWIVVDEQSIEAWTAPDRLIVMDMQHAGRLAYG